MSKRAQYYLFPFSSFLPAPQHPPHAAFRERGREGSGGSCGSQVPASHLPPKCAPTGRAGGAASPPCTSHFVKALPSLAPPPLSSPPTPHQLPEGSFWGGRVLCCPCREDLALAKGARKGWNFLVLPWGRGVGVPCTSPHSGAPLRWPCSIPLPDRPSPSPVPPPWLPGLETFFGKWSPRPPPPSPWDEEKVGHTQKGQAGSPALGT